MPRFLSICVFLFFLTGCATSLSHSPDAVAAQTEVPNVQANDASGRTALLLAGCDDEESGAA